MSSAERSLSGLDSNDVWEGFKSLLPISFFVIVFGVAFGLAAVQAGLGESSIMAMSTLVFAGAAQFAVLKLWGEHVPLIPLIITVFAINARHLLMGATLYPWLRELPRAKRYGVMLVVSTQTGQCQCKHSVAVSLDSDFCSAGASRFGRHGPWGAGWASISAALFMIRSVGAWTW